jgi:hypothetical protein
MKNTIVKIVAFLAVIIGMTGIAAANPVSLEIMQGTPNQTEYPGNPIELAFAGSVNLSLHILSPFDTEYDVTCTLSGPDTLVTVSCPTTLSTGGANDITFPDAVNVTNNGATAGNEYNLLIEIKGHTFAFDTSGPSISFHIQGPPAPITFNISGYKINDTNGNGIWNAGELGIQGWNITLLNATTSTEIAKTSTGANGFYNFTGLVNGTYNVTEETKAGFTHTNATFRVVKIDGKDVMNVNFTNNVTVIPPAPKTSNISGIKFNDLNGNGIRDAGEPGLANWTITLTNDTGVTITRTTVNGGYNFTNLTDGNYTVGEVIQPGWIQTAPAVSATCSATFKVQISGNAVTGKNFGNFKFGSVSGTKFEDLNANGVRDSNESGLAGWNITINGTDSITGTTVTQTTTTQANGNYNFTGLTAGTYTISETQKVGWVQTAPATGTYTVTITTGAVNTGQNFGNFHKGKITGGGWISIKGDPKATFGLVGQYPGSSNTAQGNVQYQDHVAKLNINSIQINTVATTLDMKKGAITGLAQVNGKGSYPFVVYVEDNGEPGIGIDVFKISLPIYPYSNGAVLSGGNIQIHS